MSEQQKTILVTGGSGFIGSVTCKFLVDSGYNVINIDRAKRQQEGVHQYPFDIDNHQLEGVIALTKPDAVIHLAADHSVPLSIEAPADTYYNNVANSIALLKHCVRNNVKHFVFSSSSSVYGNSDFVLLKGEQFTINGDDYDTRDGTCERDYTHVADIASAHVSALNYLFDGGPGGVFNIGGGSSKSIKNVIAEVEKQLDLTLDTDTGPRREGDADKTSANIARAWEEFGWEANFGLEDIVRDEIAYQQSLQK